MRVLVTGSRDWDLPAQIGAILRDVAEWAWNSRALLPAQITVVHGAARGADLMADACAVSLGMKTEPHPANWAQFGKAAGSIRNAHMVSLGADLCLAFIRPCVRTAPCDAALPAVHDSHGAAQCVKVATLAGITVKIYRRGFP